MPSLPDGDSAILATLSLLEEAESEAQEAARDTRKSAGGALRRLREGRGLSLREVARGVGWSPSYLSDLEIGNRMLTHDKAAQLLRAQRALAAKRNGP